MKLTDRELGNVISIASEVVLKDRQSIKGILENSKKKIEIQIDTLENILNHGEEDKGVNYYKQALEALKDGLEALNEVENMPSNAGRKKTIDDNKILEMRASGMTQEAISRELNISTISVRRAEKRSQMLKATNGLSEEVKKNIWLFFEDTKDT